MSGTSSLYPDPIELIRGRQKIANAGPWLGDNAKLTFGDDSDGYIWFNTGTGTVEIVGMSIVIPATGLAIPAGDDLTVAGAGDSKFDFHLGTGIFKTTTGANTLGGDTTIATGKDLLFAGGDSAADFSLGSGLFKTTAGDVTIGPGAIGVSGDVTVAAAKSISGAAGAGAIDFHLMTGTFQTPTGAHTINGAVTFAANKGIAYTAGTGAADFVNGTGIFRTTTGAVTIGPGTVAVSGNVTFAAAVTLGADAGAGAVDFSTMTGTFKTPTGINTISGEAVFAKKLQVSQNATINVDTTITSASTKTNYGIDASSGDVYLTLPDAATVAGVLYVVGLDASPGVNSGGIKATAGKIGGAGGSATGMESTDDGAGIMVVSNGTDYLIVGSHGTWTAV